MHTVSYAHMPYKSQVFRYRVYFKAAIKCVQAISFSKTNSMTYPMTREIRQYSVVDTWTFSNSG